MAAVCMNDAATINREDYESGIAWHDAGNGYSSGASAYFCCGWDFAYSRSLVRQLFKGRNNSGCQHSNRYWLRHHLERARRYRRTF